MTGEEVSSKLDLGGVGSSFGRAVGGAMFLALILVGCGDASESVNQDAGAAVDQVEDDQPEAEPAVDKAADSNEEDLGFSFDAVVGRHEELLTGRGSVPAEFGPELAAGSDVELPAEGIAVFDHGTVAIFAVDGTVAGHLPGSAIEAGDVSLVDWFASFDRHLTPMPTRTGGYPCSSTETTDTRIVELCAREHDHQSIPTVTVDGAELVTEGHWAAFYEESGWSWEDAGGGVVGHYRQAQYDPASDAWLFDWSGECESTDALLFHEGRLSHVSGSPWEEATSANATGFAAGAAIYTTEAVDEASCGTGADPSTVAAATPGGDVATIWTASEGAANALTFGS